MEKIGSISVKRSHRILVIYTFYFVCISCIVLSWSTRGVSKQIKRKLRENRRGNKEWTIVRHWQHWTQKTHDEDQNKKQKIILTNKLTNKLTNTSTKKKTNRKQKQRKPKRWANIIVIIIIIKINKFISTLF